MSIVDRFGAKVGETAEKDPVRARKLLLAGYRLQEKRLALFPDRKLPMSGQYVAKIVMNNIIQALAKPENAAMVSIFVPGETDREGRLSGNYVLVSQGFSGRSIKWYSAKAKVHGVYKPGMRWQYDDISVSQGEI